MFEARIAQGGLLKKVVDAVKELISDANVEATTSGLALQAMDSSHVCLVSMKLRADGFEHYRCDRSLVLGLQLANFAKILKCAGDKDIITLKADDDPDTITLMFENPTQDRISDFDMKLMTIDTEQLGIPETEYTATIRMPAGDYARIVKDLSTIGEQVVVAATKEGVKFSVTGDIGTANITCRHNTSADKPEEQTIIEVMENVSMSFGTKYLVQFAKATPLSGQVTISMTKDLPIVVEYQIADIGYLRYYLAPKIDDEEEADAAGGGMDEDDEP